MWLLTRSGKTHRIGIVFCSIVGLWCIVEIQSFGPPSSKRLAAQLVIASAILVGNLAVWGPMPFIAVTPRGIMYRWLRKTKTIGWSHVIRAGEQYAIVIQKKIGTFGEDYRQYLPNKSDQAEFRRAVNDGKKRYDSPTE